VSREKARGGGARKSPATNASRSCGGTQSPRGVCGAVRGGVRAEAGRREASSQPPGAAGSPGNFEATAVRCGASPRPAGSRRAADGMGRHGSDAAAASGSPVGPGRRSGRRPVPSRPDRTGPDPTWSGPPKQMADDKVPPRRHHSTSAARAVRVVRPTKEKTAGAPRLAYLRLHRALTVGPAPANPKQLINLHFTSRTQPCRSGGAPFSYALSSP